MTKSALMCPLMTRYLLRWLLNALAFMGTAYLIPGFEISGLSSALLASIVVGLGNVLLWPLLILLTLPINILTLGLFTFVVNGMVIKICAAFVPGFAVQSWLAAILGSMILSILNSLLHRFVFWGPPFSPTSSWNRKQPAESRNFKREKNP